MGRATGARRVLPGGLGPGRLHPFGCLPAEPGRPALDGLGNPARHGRRATTHLDAGDVAALAEDRPLLAHRRRPLDGLARPAWRLGEQARGRPHDPGRHLRLRPSHVRDRRQPGSPVSLPPDRLRRLVGRGSELALLQPLPARPMRLQAAVPRHERGPLTLPDGLPALCVDPLQRRPGRARAGVGDLPARQYGQADARVREPASPPPGRAAALAATREQAADRDRPSRRDQPLSSNR